MNQLDWIPSGTRRLPNKAVRMKLGADKNSKRQTSVAEGGKWSAPPDVCWCEVMAFFFLSKAEQTDWKGRKKIGLMKFLHNGTQVETWFTFVKQFLALLHTVPAPAVLQIFTQWGKGELFCSYARVMRVDLRCLSVSWLLVWEVRCVRRACLLWDESVQIPRSSFLPSCLWGNLHDLELKRNGAVSRK